MKSIDKNSLAEGAKGDTCLLQSLGMAESSFSHIEWREACADIGSGGKLCRLARMQIPCRGLLHGHSIIATVVDIIITRCIGIVYLIQIHACSTTKTPPSATG
jgi:hypothetical protein